MNDRTPACPSRFTSMFLAGGVAGAVSALAGNGRATLPE
jgi:hypothetical protein